MYFFGIVYVIPILTAGGECDKKDQICLIVQKKRIKTWKEKIWVNYSELYVYKFYTLLSTILIITFSFSLNQTYKPYSPLIKQHN